MNPLGDPVPEGSRVVERSRFDIEGEQLEWLMLGRHSEGRTTWFFEVDRSFESLVYLPASVSVGAGGVLWSAEEVEVMAGARCG